MPGVIRATAVLVCLYALVGTVQGQPRVDARNSYERVLAVVPLVGSGTVEDPIRPMFAPAPGATDTVGRTGIIAFTYVLSDDGKFALVEFVARDRTGLQPILGATNVKAFIKGVHQRADIEGEFKKYKKDFDASKFGVHVQ